MAYVDANVGGAIRIRDLAEVAGLSLSYFHRQFRARFGISPRAYILLRRIRTAQRLLVQTGDSLSQISLACGMSDQPHFARTFRRFVGATPRHWRLAQTRVGAGVPSSVQTHPTVQGPEDV